MTDKVINKIVSTADGSPRKAIVLLEQVSKIAGEDKQLDAIVLDAVERQGFDLVKALLWESTDWAKLIPILRDIREQKIDLEPLRWSMLTCAGNELLKGERRAGWCNLIIDCFKKSFFESGYSGMFSACFEVMQVRAKIK